MSKAQNKNKMKGRFPIKEAFLFYCTPVDGRLPSYADVAMKFNINERRVEKWGSRNGWVKEREKSGEKAATAFFEQREKMILDTDRKQFEQLEMLEEGILNAIKMLTDQQRQILSDQTLDIETKIKLMKNVKMQSLDLKSLADAMKTAQNQKRIILGMPTDISKAEINQTNRNASLTPEEMAEMDEFVRKNNAGNNQAS